MFEKYGWEEPKDFQELVDLCKKIRTQAEGVTPIVMGGAAVGYYFTTMTSYAQAEFLYTPEGHRWEDSWRRGEASAGDGFGDGIAMTQELIDAGAFDHEKNLDLWDVGLFRNRMLTGEAAMMFLWGGHTPVAQAMIEQQEISFGLMPFRNRTGQAFVGTNIPYYVGVPKALSKKGNEKKLEQVLRVVEWLSSEEGMESFSTEALSAIFPLRSGENGQVLPIFQNFWNEHLDSIKAPMLYAGYEDVMVPAAEMIIEAVQGKTRLDHLDRYMDEIHAEYLKNGVEAIEAGSFTRNFTHEETVQTMAHMLQSRADSDITLVSSGDYKNGIMNDGGVYAQFYKGPVIRDQLTCYAPGSNITHPMMQMTLKGSRIKQLLEKGKHCTLTENGPQKTDSDEGAEASADFEYYWDGMKVKFKDGKVKSAVLESGETLEDDKEYTVSFAFGDYTQEVEEEGKPVELPYTAREVIEEYMAENSPVSPSAVLR